MRIVRENRCKYLYWENPPDLQGGKKWGHILEPGDHPPRGIVLLHVFILSSPSWLASLGSSNLTATYELWSSVYNDLRSDSGFFSSSDSSR